MSDYGDEPGESSLSHLVHLVIIVVRSSQLANISISSSRSLEFSTKAQLL